MIHCSQGNCKKVLEQSIISTRIFLNNTTTTTTTSKKSSVQKVPPPLPPPATRTGEPWQLLYYVDFFPQRSTTLLLRAFCAGYSRSGRDHPCGNKGELFLPPFCQVSRAFGTTLSDKDLASKFQSSFTYLHTRMGNWSLRQKKLNEEKARPFMGNRVPFPIPHYSSQKYPFLGWSIIIEAMLDFRPRTNIFITRAYLKMLYTKVPDANAFDRSGTVPSKVLLDHRPYERHINPNHRV